MPGRRKALGRGVLAIIEFEIVFEAVFPLLDLDPVRGAQRRPAAVEKIKFIRAVGYVFQCQPQAQLSLLGKRGSGADDKAGGGQVILAGKRRSPELDEIGELPFIDPVTIFRSRYSAPRVRESSSKLLESM